MTRAWTVVVAAGTATRYGRPKLLEPLGDGVVVDHAIATAAAATDGVVLVADDPLIVARAAGHRTVSGGATRSESVRAGLAAIPADVGIVLVHDAARPAAGADLFERVVAAVAAGAVAVVPAVPVTDTIKQVDASGRVVATPDRTSLVAVQTPQGFRRDALVAAHAGGGDATDDAALIEARGGTVVTVPGDPSNVKLTTPRDLAVLRATWQGAGPR